MFKLPAADNLSVNENDDDADDDDDDDDDDDQMYRILCDHIVIINQNSTYQFICPRNCQIENDR